MQGIEFVKYVTPHYYYVKYNITKYYESNRSKNQKSGRI